MSPSHSISSMSTISDIEDLVERPQEAILDSQKNLYPDKGQQFFGLWEFNNQDVEAMLFGHKCGPVCSSLVEFLCVDGFFGSQFKFGVQLNLSCAAGDGFVLSWQPCVLTPGLLPEHIDCLEIHLHGSAAKPSLSPLSYAGPISMLSSPPAPLPVLDALSVEGVMELLECENLICALTIHFYCLGNVALVTPVKGFEAKAQVGYRWTESGRKLRRRSKVGELWSQKSLD